MNSGKNIVIAAPKLTAADTLPNDVSPAELDAMFEDLRELMQACGSNMHDRMVKLIAALIGEGINLGPCIIAAAKSLGFDGRHAGIRLDHGIGQRWRREDDGTYHIILEARRP